MKTFIYLGVVILLLGGGWYFFTKDNSKGNESSYTSLSGITLYKESGMVSIKTPDSYVTKSVTESSVNIPNKTTVTTGTSSRASVLLPDNSMISLSANTEIVINYTATSTSIFQSLGSTYHRVQALVSGKSYEVQTPSTLAAVRGTKFAVLYDTEKKSTKIAVTENKVAVSRIKRVETTATPIFESPVLVESGNTANVVAYTTNEVKGTQAVTVIASKEDKDVTNWIEENKVLDNTFIEIKNNTDNNGNKDKFKEELDKAIIEKINTDIQKEDANKTETSLNNTKKDDTTNIEATDTKKTETESVIKTTDTTNTAKKYSSDEEFFTAFDDLFIKYLYADNDDAVCKITVSPTQKVKEIVDLAESNNHTINNSGITSLANDLKSYCDKNLGDGTMRVSLQSRFDDVTPSF